jgi:hypothetical protein
MEWEIINYEDFCSIERLAWWSLIPVTTRSKTWVYGSSTAGIVGSNPSMGMGVCLLWGLCVVR